MNDYKVQMKNNPGQQPNPDQTAAEAGTDVTMDEKQKQVQTEMVQTLENLEKMISMGQTEQAINLIQQEIQRLGGTQEPETPDVEDDSELSAQLMKALS